MFTFMFTYVYKYYFIQIKNSFQLYKQSLQYTKSNLFLLSFTIYINIPNNSKLQQFNIYRLDRLVGLIEIPGSSLFFPVMLLIVPVVAITLTLDALIRFWAAYSANLIFRISFDLGNSTLRVSSSM